MEDCTWRRCCDQRRSEPRRLSRDNDRLTNAAPRWAHQSPPLAWPARRWHWCARPLRRRCCAQSVQRPGSYLPVSCPDRALVSDLWFISKSLLPLARRGAGLFHAQPALSCCAPSRGLAVGGLDESVGGWALPASSACHQSRPHHRALIGARILGGAQPSRSRSSPTPSLNGDDRCGAIDDVGLVPVAHF